VDELKPSEHHVLLLRELLADAHILVERCHKAVKEMQGSADYDARTRALALQDFAERLAVSASGLRQAALHPPPEGQLL
jgi:hypothetical protein